MTHNLRQRQKDENCWCGALAGEPCVTIRSFKPMRTYTHMLTVPANPTKEGDSNEEAQFQTHHR